MTSHDHAQNREFQQDARAWAAFTGTNYTSALRQMNFPLAQGLLGERVSARRLIAALGEHELVGANGGAPDLGENGVRSDSRWSFNGKTDYIELALITDMVRMFTPTSGSEAPEVGSYSLKHTAERFLSPHFSYVSNGRVIWAAAALGLPIADANREGPNLLIGISEREHDYVRRMVGSGQTRPQANHYRPAGYEHLRAVLARAAAAEVITESWVRPEPVVEPSPFHDWLVQQVGRNHVLGDLAGDYSPAFETATTGLPAPPTSSWRSSTRSHTRPRPTTPWSPRSPSGCGQSLRQCPFVPSGSAEMRPTMKGGAQGPERQSATSTYAPAATGRSSRSTTTSPASVSTMCGLPAPSAVRSGASSRAGA